MLRQSVKTGHAVYHTDWPLLSVSEKRDLLMIMMRSTRPIKFTSSFLITLSLDSYSNVSIIVSATKMYICVRYTERQKKIPLKKYDQLLKVHNHIYTFFSDLKNIIFSIQCVATVLDTNNILLYQNIIIVLQFLMNFR